MGKYEVFRSGGYEANSQRYIANELAEANRLKRIGIMNQCGFTVPDAIKELMEQLEDQA